MLSFIQSIQGPYFLGLYPIYITILSLLFWIYISYKDKSIELYNNYKIDKYDFWILNHKSNKYSILSHLLVILYTKGLIDIDTNKKPFLTEKDYNEEDECLNDELLYSIYTQVEHLSSIIELFSNSDIFNAIRNLLKDKQKILIENKLILKSFISKIDVFIFCVLSFLPGILKLYLGLERGKPIFLLLLELIFLTTFLRIFISRLKMEKSKLGSKVCIDYSKITTSNIHTSDFTKYSQDDILNYSLCNDISELDEIPSIIVFSSILNDSINTLTVDTNSSDISCSSCSSCGGCGSS